MDITKAELRELMMRFEFDYGAGATDEEIEENVDDFIEKMEENGTLDFSVEEWDADE
jgi:uncharacterized protein YggL (DUF469 family)